MENFCCRRPVFEVPQRGETRISFDSSSTSGGDITSKRALVCHSGRSSHTSNSPSCRTSTTNATNFLRVCHSQHILVLVDHASVHGFVEDVDLCLCEIACADLALEKKIQLREGPASGLRNAEVGVDDTQEAEPGPKEGRVVLYVQVSKMFNYRHL